MTLRLQDSIAIITGSSRGIGSRIAEIFAENGASVVINYLQSEADANLLAQKIKERTAFAPLVVKADVSTSEGINTLVNSTIAQFGRVDILVNNAGITIRGSTMDINEEKWDHMLAVNLKGPFLCSKAVIPYMLKNKRGSIVNIASIRGITGSSSSVHYAAAKSGILTMTRSLALEFAPYIRVNAVAPGYTLTDLHAHLGAEDKKKIENSIPLKRFGSVDDIANAVLFFASNDSSYVTGETLIVSGGLVMH